PGAAVRVVLERVQVTRRRTEIERDLRHLAGRARMVGGQLAALLGLAVAAPARREDDGRRLERVLAASGAPAVLGRLECGQGRLGEDLRRRALDGVTERGRDRVACAVADLQQ